MGICSVVHHRGPTRDGTRLLGGSGHYKIDAVDAVDCDNHSKRYGASMNGWDCAINSFKDHRNRSIELYYAIIPSWALHFFKFVWLREMNSQS